MNREFKKGVLAAAAVADSYNSVTSHKFRLGDCIALKLNVLTRASPRLNREKLERPDDAVVRGMALALADVHRIGRHSSEVCGAAAAAGLTITLMKAAGVPPYDWRELKKAGVL